MDFRILGPLEAHDGDDRLALGGARQRALLGLLLLHANEVVSSDRLVEELWSEERPDRAPQGAAGRRLASAASTLEPDRCPEARTSSVLVTRPPGYELRRRAGQLDLHRFEDLVAEGRTALAAGDAGTASGTLRAALALWRGPPLGDLAYESFAQAEIAAPDGSHSVARGADRRRPGARRATRI